MKMYDKLCRSERTIIDSINRKIDNIGENVEKVQHAVFPVISFAFLCPSIYIRVVFHHHPVVFRLKLKHNEKKLFHITNGE